DVGLSACGCAPGSRGRSTIPHRSRSALAVEAVQEFTKKPAVGDLGKAARDCRSATPIPIAADQGIGRAVVSKGRVSSDLQFGHDALGELLTQLDAPLVERVDVPDRSLNKDAVLVQRDELAERFWSQPLDQECARWPVAFEGSMRHKPCWSAF